MKCDEFNKLISPLLDNELDGITTDACEHHASECLQCRRQFEKIRKCSVVFGEIPVLDLSIPATASLLERGSSGLFLAAFLRPVLVICTLFILLISGFSVSRVYQDKASPTPSVSSSLVTRQSTSTTIQHQEKLSSYNISLPHSNYQLAVKGRGVRVLSVKAWEH